MQHVGVDGCREGWIAVTRSQGDLGYAIFSALSELILAYEGAELVLIDIPIGLPWKEVPIRPCDAHARSILGRPRSSSVFPVPCRDAVHASDPLHACQVNEAILGRRLSKQTLGIRDKIAEVDSLVTSRQGTPALREVHPEVCFWALAGGLAMLHNKKSAAGQSERLKVLTRRESRASTLLQRALSETRRVQVKADDVLDALVAFVTAEAPPRSLRSLGGNSPKDKRGLTMEMVYLQET